MAHYYRSESGAVLVPLQVEQRIKVQFVQLSGERPKRKERAACVTLGIRQDSVAFLEPHNGVPQSFKFIECCLEFRVCHCASLLAAPILAHEILPQTSGMSSRRLSNSAQPEFDDYNGAVCKSAPISAGLLESAMDPACSLLTSLCHRAFPIMSMAVFLHET